jgi:nuclear GTP-binding protein
LEQLARKSGKLLKGAEPDTNTIAKMLLNDWQRGKLPFYVAPVGYEHPKSALEKKAPTEADTTSPQPTTEEVTDETASQTSTAVSTAKSISTPSLTDAVKKGKEFVQLQDFRKIKVNLTFGSEDEQELDKVDIELLEKLKKEKETTKKQKKPKNDDEDSSGISDFYSEDEYDEVAEELVHKNAGTKRKATASGAFVVEEAPKEQPSTSSKAKKSMTSKQKRAVDRAQKPKKVGSNFYDVVNVKNKSRSKKFKQ